MDPALNCSGGRDILIRAKHIPPTNPMTAETSAMACHSLMDDLAEGVIVVTPSIGISGVASGSVEGYSDIPSLDWTLSLGERILAPVSKIKLVLVAFYLFEQCGQLFDDFRIFPVQVLPLGDVVSEVE